MGRNGDSDKPIPFIKIIFSGLYTAFWKARLAFGIVFNYTEIKMCLGMPSFYSP